MTAGGFVHLHVHSDYSLLDGAARVGDLVESAKRCGMRALALTDHGNMFGAAEFYQAAMAAGIKPIVGYEAYVAPESRLIKKQAPGRAVYYHLTLLARNDTGYKNLLRLATSAYLTGFYYRPRIDKDVLKECAEGLVILSGCLSSELSRRLLADDYEGAKKIAQEYRGIAEPGMYFLELQDHGLEDQKKVLRGKVRLSEELGIPLVATNDIHYINKDDAFAHEVLMCIQTGKRIEDQDRMRLSTQEYYFKTPEEMGGAFSQFPEALARTAEIAEMCNVELAFDRRHLPKYRDPDGRDMVTMFRELCHEGARQHYPDFDTNDEVKERLEHEMKVIMEMGFVSYFMIVWDFIRYAREQGVAVGPGRGSAAGSMVAYCMGITGIEPLRYGLLFERFLNAERISMPDIDIDFAPEGREKIISYVRERYGRENVAQIITFGTMAARGVVRDVGRVLNLPLSDIDALAKKIPAGMKLREAVEKEPVLKSSYETDDTYRNLFDISFKLEGLNRHASTHAAGVVVSDAPLVTYVPLYESNSVVSTQFSMGALEALGLMKMDFLGLITLTVLEETLRNIRETGEELPDLAGLPLDDRKTYKLLGRGEGRGLFQLESSGMRELLSRLKPDSFDDLIAILALYRPGPLGKGMVESYIMRKQGKQETEHLHPLIAPILKNTYGVILYQEQVMQIANVLAGFTLNEADSLRKAMGKKKPEIMEEFRGKFVSQSVGRKVEEKSARNIFEHIEQFAGYGFNKSHSTAYALIAYQTAYLKANYPVQFMAALMTSEAGNKDKLAEYIAECERMGIKILPPDVNKSRERFTVEGKSVRFGLAAVKNVGAKAVESIMSSREEQPYRSLFDFCERVDLRDCNKQMIDSLIKCGAFDSFGAKRAQLAGVLDEAMEAGARLQRDRKMGQKTFFEAFLESSPKTARQLPDVPEWPESQLLAHEKEMLGFYLTSHPLAKHKDVLRGYSTATTSTLSQVHDNRTVTIGGLLKKVQVRISKRGNRFISIEFEDLDGSCDAVVLRDVERLEKLLKPDAVVFLQGNVDTARDQTSIRIKNVIQVSEAPKSLPTRLIINVPDGAGGEEDLEKLRRIIEKHRGASRVLMTVPAGDSRKVRVSLPRTFSVEVGKKLITKIEALFGPEHVTYSALGMGA